MGIDKDRFTTEDIPDHCICQICAQVLDEPVCCPDKHWFCFGCISPHIAERSSCPIDLREITESDLNAVSAVIEEELSKLHLRCAYAIRGCKEEFYLADVSQHESDCQWKSLAVDDKETIVRLQQQLCDFQSQVLSLELELNKAKKVAETEKKLSKALLQNVNNLRQLVKQKDEQITDLQDQLQDEDETSCATVIKTTSDSFGAIKAFLHRQVESRDSETVIPAQFVTTKYDTSEDEEELPDGFETMPLSFSCEKCSYTTWSKRHLQRHEARHADSRPFPCDFPDCNERFTQKYLMESHKLTHSGKKKFIVCPVEGCGVRVARSDKLRRHIRALHPGNVVKDYKCDKCQYMTYREKTFLYHMAKHSPSKRPFKCSYDGCEMTFTASKSLERHEITHTGLKPFGCKCGKAFNRTDKLKIHQKTCKKGPVVAAI